MGNYKHILVLNRSFWPDIEATGQFLTELCEELSKKYRITVVAGRSYYIKGEDFKPWLFYNVEQYSGVEILRVRHTRFWKRNLALRIINWMTYSLLTFIAAIRIKCDLIIVCTDPPFLGIIAMVINHFKAIPYICNCRDLYPDVAWALGRLRKTSPLSRLFDYLNKKALQKAALIVCLGPSMAERIKAKGVKGEKIKVISDCVDTALIKPISKEANPLIGKFGLKDKFIIMHSGNIGLSQDFSTLLRAIAAINNSLFSLVFVGDGAGKKRLRKDMELLGLKNILFLPYQPKEMLSLSLGMADLHLILLRKGMSGTVIPSKIYGIMAAGRPYLALADIESEPAHLAKECGIGLWSAPEDMNNIANNVQWALTHPAELKRMGEVGRRLAEERFNKNVVVNRWLKVLDL